MKRPTIRHDDPTNTTMTPMIDVVFLLLIFFVIAATGQAREFVLLTELTGTAIESKAKSDKKDDPVARVWIFLRREGEGVAVRALQMYGTNVTAEKLQNARNLSLDELGGWLKGLSETKFPVVLDVGDRVKAGDWLHVYDLCRGAKFENINFAVGSGEEVGRFE